MIGLLMLVGIVVTNAIVLIDLVEQYRDQGLPVQQALIEGGRHRLRPILMTASATMLALSPLALSGNGGGGFISAPLAIVVIGGLFTSTVLTLVLVPVMYSLLDGLPTRIRRGLVGLARRVIHLGRGRAPVPSPAGAAWPADPSLAEASGSSWPPPCWVA